jgi:hypothetical protein
MADRFDQIDAPESEPVMGANARQARWSLAIMAGIVVVLGLVFFAISADQGAQKMASNPAVMAAPAPAAGVPPPARETTTGQAVPSAVPSTTGRGGTERGAD